MLKKGIGSVFPVATKKNTHKRMLPSTLNKLVFEPPAPVLRGIRHPCIFHVLSLSFFSSRSVPVGRGSQNGKTEEEKWNTGRRKRHAPRSQSLVMVPLRCRIFKPHSGEEARSRVAGARTGFTHLPLSFFHSYRLDRDGHSTEVSSDPARSRYHHSFPDSLSCVIWYLPSSPSPHCRRIRNK